MPDLFQGERVMAVIKRDKVPTAVMQAVQRAEMFLIPWTAGRDVYVNRPINPKTD